MANVPLLTLNNGMKMPFFGLGTYLYKGGEAVVMIKKAIDFGYRHFDTAFLYNTESEVGEAIREKIAEGVVSRSELFVSTKMWTTYNDPDKVEYACRNSLKNLGIDYIDLFLMHFPISLHYENDEELWPKTDDGCLHITDIDYLETWKAMENLVNMGLVKSIGVSNFNSTQIDRLYQFATIKPVANQVECCPTLNQRKLIEFCKEREIVIIAYCPLRHPVPTKQPPDFLVDDQVKNIAQKYNKLPAQIVLRYLVHLGVVPIPKTINQERLLSNISIFDFTLTEDEISFMHTFNTGERLVKSLNLKHSKYWPFSLEY